VQSYFEIRFRRAFKLSMSDSFSIIRIGRMSDAPNSSRTQGRGDMNSTKFLFTISSFCTLFCPSETSAITPANTMISSKAPIFIGFSVNMPLAIDKNKGKDVIVAMIFGPY